MKDAGDASPNDLKSANSKGRNIKIGKTRERLWFTPTIDRVDLDEAKDVILRAKQAILFLMFNPGPNDSLLNSIIAAARKKRGGQRLYIKGAINQDPSTSKNPVKLFDQANVANADYDVVLPAAIDKATTYFVREMKKLPSRHYAALGQLRPAFQRARVIVCGFGCSRTHRVLSSNEPEGGVENVFGLTGRARHSGRGAPSLR